MAETQKDVPPLEYWIVQAQENPAGPREKIGRREWRSNTLCETLADRGHKVVRWRSAFSHQAKVFLASGNTSEPHDNYVQRFIGCTAYESHVSLARIRSHRDLARNFLLMARQGPAPALIHVGNVPISLALAAVRYANEVNCPVVIDIRDLWPDIFADLLPEKMSVLRPAMIKLMHACAFPLKNAMRNATAITALTQSYMDWALKLAAREQTNDDAIFSMCYPRQTITPSDSDVANLYARLGIGPHDQVAVYLGNLGYQSDFDTILAAADKLSAKFPNFKIVLAGSGPRQNKLKKIAETSPNVIVPGWLEGVEISTLLHISQIGLIAFHPVPNYLRNIPNKFSEYLAGGLAISCGLGGEMAQLIQKEKCGFLYEPGDVTSLASALENILKDPPQLESMCNRARHLHASQFDGNKIYPAFANHLEKLAEKALSQNTQKQI